MKLNITTYTIILTALIWCTACNSLLDKEPLGRLDADTFFKTPDDAIQAVNATYGPLLINNANNNFYWAFGTVASDEALVVGSPGTELEFAL